MNAGISVAYVTQPKDRRAKPSKADLEAAERLRRIWDAVTTDRPSQEDMAEALQVNQSAISQYRNGKIPLNYRAVLGFAHRLRCRPEDIRSDLPEQQVSVRHTVTSVTALAAPKTGWPFKISRDRYDRLKPRDRAYIEKMLEQAISHCEGRLEERATKRAGKRQYRAAG